MKKLNPYHGYRYPLTIISYAVWLYHRFTLNYRDAEEPLAERGIRVGYEAIRLWCRRFGPEYSCKLRKHSGWLG